MEDNLILHMVRSRIDKPDSGYESTGVATSMHQLKLRAESALREKSKLNDTLEMAHDYYRRTVALMPQLGSHRKAT